MMLQERQSNILDPIHDTLPPSVWENPGDPEPSLKPVHAHFIKKHVYAVLEQGGYTNAHEWAHLYLTGSLCTYQYSDTSDCDVSLFVDSKHLPEWSRAEMIGLMIKGCDGVTLPATPYELQCYVVGRNLHPADLFKPGLRAGYSLDHSRWLNPPDRNLTHDVKAQENGAYAWGLMQADKMDRLLRYEPDKAVDFWHQIHRKRMRDQSMGKGDYSESNILYKFLAKRGLFPQIAQLSGEHIAAIPVGFRHIGRERSYPASTTRTASSSLAQQVYAVTMQNGGASFDMNGVQPSTGYAFSPYKASETVVPMDTFTPDVIDQYLKQHFKELQLPGHHVGTWVDNGQVYLDISVVEPDYQRANALANQANQLAMYHIDSGQTINLPGNVAA